MAIPSGQMLVPGEVQADAAEDKHGEKQNKSIPLMIHISHIIFFHL